jgi:DNA-binding NarL/FixJ family response regulator
VIRVLVADDQAIVRDGLTTVLSLADDVEVVGEAADGARAVELAASTRPDVVLMDLRMPVMDGATATARLREAAPGTRVLVLTTFADDGSIQAALAAGAVGYLTKDAGRHEVLAAIRAAAAGQSVFAPEVAGRLVAGFAPPPSPRERFPGLTPREAEVLDLLAEGRTNREIAGSLFLTPATVKSYVTQIFAKLGVATRAEAVARVLGR